MFTYTVKITTEINVDGIKNYISKSEFECPDLWLVANLLKGLQLRRSAYSYHVVVIWHGLNVDKIEYVGHYKPNKYNDFRLDVHETNSRLPW